MTAGGNFNLYGLADAVDSEESFVRFLHALAADFEEEQRLLREHPPEKWTDMGALGWRQGSVDSYLDAVARWTLDSSERTGPSWVGEEPTWRGFAHILHAGKFYE